MIRYHLEPRVFVMRDVSHLDLEPPYSGDLLEGLGVLLLPLEHSYMFEVGQPDLEATQLAL